MTRRLVTLFILLFLPATTACTDQSGTSFVGPDAEVSRHAAHHDARPDRAGAGALSVLTWNVYYGTDLTLALGGPSGLLELVGLLQATDMPARAAAIAEQIDSARPHLVGLQEVAHWAYDDGETSFDLDFLAMLLEDLEGYVVANETLTFAPPPLGPISFEESVVVLAREDLDTTNPKGDVFAIGLPIEELGLTLTKGWASVDASLKGRTYRFVTTHLEPTDFTPVVQELQATELLETLEAMDGPDVPIVLTGDLNSEPDARDDEPYAQMADAGFVDTWLVSRRRGDGYTSGQDADLANEESDLRRRIDYVLYRDAVTTDSGPYRGAVHAERVGEEPADRTDAGLWPSDHAGVLGVLRTEQSRTP